MERPIAYEGAQLTVVYAVALNGSSPGLQYYEEQTPKNQARLNKLFQWLGDHGWIKNDQKFKPIEGTDFFEFKDFQIRMPCFRRAAFMIITHGFNKKQGKMPPQEIERAKRLREEDAECEKRERKGKCTQFGRR